jgi:hypothetical protein
VACGVRWTLSLTSLLKRTLRFLLDPADLCLPQSCPYQTIWFRDPGSRNVGQVIDVVTDVLWINRFPLRMHTPIRQIDSPVDL